MPFPPIFDRGRRTTRVAFEVQNHSARYQELWVYGVPLKSPIWGMSFTFHLQVNGLLGPPS
jgi:hypothetical protein